MFCDRPLLLSGVLATGLLAATPPAMAQDDLRERITTLMSGAYPVILRQVGAAARPGTAEWTALLTASVDAVLAVRPAECPPVRYGVDLCGIRPALSVSTAMAPGLREGEAVMVKPYDAARGPQRGDIVVFDVPPDGGTGRPTRMMFRLIGLAGETIALRDGRIEIDGTPVTLESTSETIAATIGDGRLQVFRETTPEGRSYRIARDMAGRAFGSAENAGPYRVPPQHVLVLGDNRHNAADSRYPDRLGGSSFVPVERILGRLLVVYAAAQPGRIGTSLVPDGQAR
jgi:signal peptidase I